MPKKITDEKIGRILDLADRLADMAKQDPDAFLCAKLTAQILQDADTEDMTAAGMKNIARLAARIANEMPGTDEPRFSMADYADAYANARDPVDLAKLLALDEESFAAAMIWLAADKRETYEGTGHFQPPLEVDIR